jgi:hypothetical protein
MALRTLAQIRRAVQKFVPSPQLTQVDCDEIIDDVHRTFGTYQWSYRRRETIIQTTAPYSTGTASITSGSSTVTGSGTAWTAAMVGRQIRLGTEYPFFYVGSINVGAQTLVLADAQLASVTWVAEAVVNGTYTIFQDQFAVPAEVAIIMEEVGYWPLWETSLTEIDFLDPRRVSTGTGQPDRWYWCRDKVESATQFRYIGLWPVPGRAVTMRMPYLIEPPPLAADTDLPICPSEVLELAAGMKAALFVFAKTGDQRWAVQAKALQQALFGSPETPSSAGMMGILQQAFQDDAHKFGLPVRLGGTSSRLGLDEWALHDFEARGF